MGQGLISLIKSRPATHVSGQLRHAGNELPEFLSAHALAGEREKALAAGCNEFDTKPIEFDRLVATLRRILASHK
jgi:CheY-like chemotaxis protein